MHAHAHAALALALALMLCSSGALAIRCDFPKEGFAFYSVRNGDGKGPGLMRTLTGRSVSTSEKCKLKCENDPRCFGWTHYYIRKNGPYNRGRPARYVCFLYDKKIQKVVEDPNSFSPFYEKIIYGGRCV